MTLDLEIMMKFTQDTQNILSVCIQVDRNSLEDTHSLFTPRFLVFDLDSLMPGHRNTCPEREHLVSSFGPFLESAAAAACPFQWLLYFMKWSWST